MGERKRQFLYKIIWLSARTFAGENCVVIGNKKRKKNIMVFIFLSVNNW